MFDLKEPDFQGRILGCGDGPACFNSVANQRGIKVVSCDPIYQFTSDELNQRVQDTFEEVIELTTRNHRLFRWDKINSVEELGEVRMSAMQAFLDDFDAGKEQGRYLSEELPTLPFNDREFSLALCSHFLFLYSEQLSLDFHRESILEMCRVAEEVRIFPLLNLQAEKSVHLDPLMSDLQKLGLQASIQRVPYEFQIGGNEMLLVRCPKSDVLCPMS